MTEPGRGCGRAIVGRSLPGALAIAAFLLVGCSGESIEEQRARIFESHRRHAHERCLANAALENYAKQCEHIGGSLHVERRTYVCRGDDSGRNPAAMGDGPYCVCTDRDDTGACRSETDCSAGIDELCAPVLSAEVRPYFRPGDGPESAGGTESTGGAEPAGGTEPGGGTASVRGAESVDSTVPDGPTPGR